GRRGGRIAASELRWSKSPMTDRGWIAGMLIAAVLSAPAPVMAASALAVGVTDKPGDGIAYGYAFNYDTGEAAMGTARNGCRGYKEAPKATPFCRIIGSVRKGCIAVAFDPKDDSPGMGWAVHEERAVAEGRALDNCRAAAPPERKQFCRIDLLKCDGDEPVKK